LRPARDRIVLPVAADATAGVEAANTPADVITGLTVEGAEICTPATTHIVEQATPIAAHCTAATMRTPALRLPATPSIAVGYTGMLFQCPRGATLSATIGTMDPDKTPVFPDHATITCPRDQALVYADSKLTCTPTPASRMVTAALAGGPHMAGATGRIDLITRTPTTTLPQCTRGPGTAMLMDGGVGE
jgi:hypothetical protein